MPISKQAKALGIGRGTVYYVPKPVSAADLAIMRRIDELHLNYPFAGSRMMAAMLRNQGVDIGRRHVGTLMKKMGIEAIYRRLNTSKPAPGQKVYPYLLRKLTVTRPNQVWAMDLTYIPMARDFVYPLAVSQFHAIAEKLTAVVNWFTRRVLTWRVSITMEATFCIEALQEALPPMASRKSSAPTKAGSSRQPPSLRCSSRPVAISMDGTGSWRDNVFVEQLWRSIKYEEVYLRAYATVAEARASIGRYLAWYNGSRPCSSLNWKTPDPAYFNNTPLLAAA